MDKLTEAEFILESVLEDENTPEYLKTAINEYFTKYNHIKADYQLKRSLSVKEATEFHKEFHNIKDKKLKS